MANSNKLYSQQNGTAAIEGALVIGLLFFFVQGIILVCVTLSNSITASQMAYSSAMAGVEQSSAQRNSAASSRLKSMFEANFKSFLSYDSQLARDTIVERPLFQPQSSSNPNVFPITVNPKLGLSVINPFIPILSSTITVPSLHVDRVAGDYSQPANPAGKYYSCDKDNPQVLTSPGPACSPI